MFYFTAQNDPVVGSCEHSNKPSGFIKGVNYLTG